MDVKSLETQTKRGVKEDGDHRETLERFLFFESRKIVEKNGLMSYSNM